MEYRFTTKLIDARLLDEITGETLTQAYQIKWDSVKNAEDIWKLGLDPNRLTALIVIPEIEK